MAAAATDFAPRQASGTETSSAPSRSDAPLALVNLPGVMALTAGAPSVVVALIDGPVALRHPDLAANRIRLAAPAETTGWSAPGSPACGHGTLVAGMLSARRDSPHPGICPGCTLLVRPIFTDAAPAQRDGSLPNATPDQLATALREVVAAGARVINLSVGLTEPGLGDDRALVGALQEVMQRGVIVVAAAGNDGRMGGTSITRLPWVIPVVACKLSGAVLAPSNLGASIGRYGISAPGDAIVSLAATGGHAPFSGTSAAVPFVSGTAALLWSLFPRASAAELRLALTGLPIGRRSVVPPLLDARAALSALRRGWREVPAI
jgi:subtilisin family serine protease